MACRHDMFSISANERDTSSCLSHSHGSTYGKAIKAGPWHPTGRGGPRLSGPRSGGTHHATEVESSQATWSAAVGRRAHRSVAHGWNRESPWTQPSHQGSLSSSAPLGVRSHLCPAECEERFASVLSSSGWTTSRKTTTSVAAKAQSAGNFQGTSPRPHPRSAGASAPPWRTRSGDSAHLGTAAGRAAAALWPGWLGCLWADSQGAAEGIAGIASASRADFSLLQIFQKTQSGGISCQTIQSICSSLAKLSWGQWYYCRMILRYFKSCLVCPVVLTERCWHHSAGKAAHVVCKGPIIGHSQTGLPCTVWGEKCENRNLHSLHRPHHWIWNDQPRRHGPSHGQLEMVKSLPDFLESRGPWSGEAPLESNNLKVGTVQIIVFHSFFWVL